jgi:hypothetical protein
MDVSSIASNDDEEYKPSASADSQSSASVILSQSTSETCSTATANDDRPPGYCLVWDNTQKLVHVRNQSRDAKNKMLLWANAYAARNRVQTRQVEHLQHVIPASSIPLASYLPTSEDRNWLHERMVVMVSRILAKHVPYFAEHCQGAVPRHIQHQFSTQSALKSQMVKFIIEVVLICFIDHT